MADEGSLTQEQILHASRVEAAINRPDDFEVSDDDPSNEIQISQVAKTQNEEPLNIFKQNLLQKLKTKPIKRQDSVVSAKKRSQAEGDEKRDQKSQRKEIGRKMETIDGSHGDEEDDEGRDAVKKIEESESKMDKMELVVKDNE